MFDVITIGSATIDVFVNTSYKLFSKKQHSINLPLGTKILVDDIKFCTGGGSTNAAVALKRLGLKTACIAKIGTDENSHHIPNELKKEKVTSYLVKEKGKTGYSIILDAVGKDRTILFHQGVNNKLKYNEIKKNIKTKWFYFSSMVDESYKTLEKLSDYAKKNNIKIFFNPSSYLVKKGYNYLKKILKNTDIMILNKEEAKILTKKKTVNDMLKTIHNYGIKIVCITDGENGNWAYDGKRHYRLKAGRPKVVETVGAGDAFASGFLASIIKKNNIELALKVGRANAESVIQHYGAKNNLLSWNKAISKIKKMRVK
ncbi:MAG: carbohydrate kinase family protein [Nanoarchaeota archaeon]|nr:carbohydrate kinase family protein [Nanoarchaeota archaeon]